jgi:O-antigen/teichoic acid export membrane protein
MYMIVFLAPVAYLGLFGPEYVEHGVWVVLLMAIAMMFAVSTGSCDSLLMMSGRSTLSLANSLIALLVDIGLCVLLIPRMGIAGAALAWAIAVSTRCLLALVQVRVTMSIVSFGRASALAALANVLAFGVPIVVVELFVDLNFFTLLAVLAGCVPLYALLLWLCRRVLMLDVLRVLIRRSQAREGDVAEELDREALSDA